MHKYHAGKHGDPMCGARGTGHRYNVVCLSAKDWNNTVDNQRCQKCAAKIRSLKAKAAH